MKFLIQKIEGELRHDFAFTLLESVRFQKWLDKTSHIKVKYANTYEIVDPDMIYPNPFKPYHKDYVPVGSVDFVTDFLMYFYNIYPKPINVPEELFGFANRQIFNGNHMDFEDVACGKYFVKSNTQIKGYKEIIDHKTRGMLPLPAGEYQISELTQIESEWRCFIYQGKLVGLQNYSGDFTMFPNVDTILHMIYYYKNAPIAYTLDVGVFDEKTFVIEVHDFFSCGLYGFANHAIYPHMLYKWFKTFTKDKPFINYNV
jgi:hypothetical protein